ncbi:unnamed protein product [Chondrus crispus]|uniref:Uncharacterized protein n=1 Tax=Chondrus crispus TaxID=2769 RepID=R7QBZ6_CHOCR|nr:unnamed protein product [Chondrus crispus]CDF36007.1 unnamed protein product [Chondrus crispus]|eukprot:XP_005715826.1 unnamed protein product [Chondrus crispus]
MSESETQFPETRDDSPDYSSARKQRRTASFAQEEFIGLQSMNKSATFSPMADSNPSQNKSSPDPFAPKAKHGVCFTPESDNGKDRALRKSLSRVPTPHPREFSEMIRKQQEAEDEEEDKKDEDLD